mgnify:CR=1 FL=1
MDFKNIKNGLIKLLFIQIIFTCFNLPAIGDNLPSTMVWSSYDIGASGYSEASALAEGMMKKYDIRVRLQPSGTSVGRLLSLRRKRVSVSFLGTEAYFASEGIHDFASKKWGPQDLRLIIGRPNTFGIAVPADTGIKTIADLKGKRVAYVTANPSLNVKVLAIMSFANLTWDDVIPITFPGFGPTIKALQNGRLDAAGAVPTGSAVYELAASKRGIKWLDMPESNKEGWQKLKKLVPFMQPQIEILGAGLNEKNPTYIGGYNYPNLTVYSDSSEQYVYSFIKALDESFDHYKDITSVMHKWRLDLSSGTPAEIPIHEGAIKYLKEKNLWSNEDESWNVARLKRLNLLRNTWKKFIQENSNLDDEKFKVEWLRERESVLAEN